MMNLAHLLGEQARIRPDALALLERGRRVTFAELDALGAQAAALLHEEGLRAGDVVLVLQPMSIDLYVALLAVFRLGLIALAFDPAAGLGHIARCCARQPPRALVASSKAHLLRLVSPALWRIPIQIAIGWPVPFATPWSRLQRSKPHPDLAEVDATTPALLTFTSGSTGLPKGVLRTHGFLRAQHAALARSLALTPGDLDVATLPIMLLANLASGVGSLIPDCDLRRPGSIRPERVVAQIRAYGATSAVASPAFFERLARHCIDQRITLPTLRKLFTGGAPVFPRTLDQMAAMAPHAEVVALYGSTEAEPIAHVARPEMADNHDGLLAGQPVPGITLRILPDRWGVPLAPLTEREFAAQCLPAHAPGEIVVSGDHVLDGYLDPADDAESKFRVNGTVWHRTGDAGYLDERGRLWLLGRCVGRIADAHGEVYPFAVEVVALRHPEVQRAVVLAHQGRRVLVVQWYDRPGDVAALRRELAWAHLAEVQVWGRIPVDARHNAKIDYLAMRRILQRGSS